MTLKVKQDDGKVCVDYWAAGKLSVCMVYWRDCKIESSKEFYGILRRCMPVGTEMLGCKLSQHPGCSFTRFDYCALIGFSYRVGCWTGLKKNLVLRCEGDACLGTERIGVLFPVKYFDSLSKSVDQFVKGSIEICLGGDEIDLFGYSLTVKVDDEGDPLYLRSAEGMWNR